MSLTGPFQAMSLHSMYPSYPEIPEIDLMILDLGATIYVVQ